MSIPKTYVPILSTSLPYTTDKREMVAAVLQYVLLNPGNTSSFMEDDLVSFRYMASAQGHNRDTMVTELNKCIPSMLQRMFPDDVIRCTFETKDYNDDSNDARFAVSFNIMFSNVNSTTPEPALLHGVFTVSPNTEIIIHYGQV